MFKRISCSLITALALATSAVHFLPVAVVNLLLDIAAIQSIQSSFCVYRNYESRWLFCAMLNTVKVSIDTNYMLF